MNDPEFDEILNKLNKLNFKKEIEEFDKQQSSQAPRKLDAELLLNLSKNPIKDKNITLGEYLAQFKKLDNEIIGEQEKRKKINESDLSKILDFINTEDQLERNMEYNKSLEDRIEKAHDSSTKNSKFISKGTPGVFVSLKNAVRQSNSNRFEIYSNTEAKLISDDLVSPLKLTQYITKKD
jgi:hypothetical protein